MGIFRLYTGNDGQSHIEEQTLGSQPALTAPQTPPHTGSLILAVEHHYI